MKKVQRTAFISTLQIDSEFHCLSDCDRIKKIIETAKIVSRATYHGVYVVDLSRCEVLYASVNICQMLGPEVFRNDCKNVGMLLEYILDDNRDMFIQAIHGAFTLYKNLDSASRYEYTVSIDCRIRIGERTRLVTHRCIPLEFTQDGIPNIIMCTVCLAAGCRSGNIIMARSKGLTFFRYELSLQKWVEQKEVVLTAQEREVLYLCAQGCTMNDIAGLIYKSLDTVKTYRRNIFAKMGVRSITQALVYAQNHQLL